MSVRCDISASLLMRVRSYPLEGWGCVVVIHHHWCRDKKLVHSHVVSMEVVYVGIMHQSPLIQ